MGNDVCYLDFDFGSPTAGSVFGVPDTQLGHTGGGLHSYFRGRVATPERVDIWTRSERGEVRRRPLGSGRLVLVPGDFGGGEFASSAEIVQRCVELYLTADEEFDLCLVDLSAGRSYAAELALSATAAPELRDVAWRWLIFHRWTPQHIRAAYGLVFGHRGILEAGEGAGHDLARLRNAVRFIRTAVLDPDSPDQSTLRPAQIAWQRERNRYLVELAAQVGLVRHLSGGVIPLEPLLQWGEQLILDEDVWGQQIAEAGTVEAFEALSALIVDAAAWESL